MHKKIITVILITITALSLSACRITLNPSELFKQNDDIYTDEPTLEESTTIDYYDISIQIPEGFRKTDNDNTEAYFNRNTTETIVLDSDEALFNTEVICEEELDDIYGELNKNTTYETINGVYMAKSHWEHENDNGINIQHVTYDFVYKGYVYEVTFAQALGEFSDYEVMQTLKLN